MFKNIILSLSACLLAACGTGGNENQGAKVGGLYIGTLNNNFAGSVDDVIGIVSETGDAVFLDLSNPALFRSNLSISGNLFDTSFKAYAVEGYEFPNGQSVTSGRVSGNVNERSSLDGLITPSGGPTSVFSLKYDKKLHELKPSFLSVAGGYSYQVCNNNGCLNVNLKIGSNGVISASDENCYATGKTSIPDLNYNVYALTFDYFCSGSSGPSTRYTGLATFVPEGTAGAGTLLFAYDNGLNDAGIVAADKL